MEMAAVYRGARERLCDLVAPLDEAGLATPVPACPGWSVRDVVAHLAGVLQCIEEQDFEGAPGPAWTQAQIDRRAGRSIAELCAEWSERAAAYEALLAGSSPGLIQLPMDCLTHEHDVRHALGRPGREPVAVDWASRRAAAVVGQQRRKAELPLLEIRVGGEVLVAGEALGPTLVAPSGFELFRAVLGRRSREQVAAWGWRGTDGQRDLDAFFLFGPTEVAMEEPVPDAA